MTDYISGADGDRNIMTASPTEKVTCDHKWLCGKWGSDDVSPVCHYEEVAEGDVAHHHDEEAVGEQDWEHDVEVVGGLQYDEEIGGELWPDPLFEKSPVHTARWDKLGHLGF